VSEAELQRIASVLRPLDAPPGPPGWNHADLVDVLGAGPRAPAAVLVGLVPHAEGVHVLLTRRTEHLRLHAGQVSFPGGRIEASDVDVIAAALRETAEETGIAPDRLQPLGYLDCFETISGFCVTPVVARLAPGYALEPDPNEVAEVFEVPLAFLLDATRLQLRHIDWRGRQREVYEYDYEGRRIWGATAAMLVNLKQRLEA